MKRCRWFGSLLVLAGLAAVLSSLTVFAQDKEAKLEWKAFDAGTKPYYQTMYVKTDQKMTVMGMTVNQTQEQTFYATWTPKTKDKDNWVVEMKIIGAKMDINIGGNKISYDSTAENPQQNPLTDFFNALLKLDLKFTITPKMTVEKIEGNEELIKNLGK